MRHYMQGFILKNLIMPLSHYNFLLLAIQIPPLYTTASSSSHSCAARRNLWCEEEEAVV